MPLHLWLRNKVGKVALDGIDIGDFEANLTLNTANDALFMLGASIGDGVLLLS